MATDALERRSTSRDSETSIAGVTLRGRENELVVLQARIDELASGSGATILISGAAGAGKSILLAATAEMAETRGIRVFRGVGDPAVQVVPLAPLLDALVTGADPPVDASSLVELSRSPDQRFWLLRELQQRLEVAALREPIVIALDDIHWADAATLSALSVLPRQLASHRVLWLLALRSDGLSREAHATVDGLESGDAVTLNLEHLTAEAVAQIAADLLGGEPDELLLQTLERVDGQPFLLVEMLRGLRDEDRVKIVDGIARLADDRLPGRFLDTVEAQMRALSDPAREAVQMASILGRRFSVEELADMVGLPPPALMRTLREAMMKGLLAEDGPRIRFRHELVRDAIRASFPEAMRQSLLRRAIEVMSSHDVRPADFASLVAEVAEPGEQGSIELLRRAAKEVGRVSPAVAAPLSLRALELVALGSEEHAEVAAETLSFLVDAGRVKEAETLLERVADELVDPSTEVNVRLHIGLLMLQYQPESAVEQCQRGLARADAPAALRAQLLSLMARSYDLLGDLAATETATRRVLDESRGTDDPLKEMMALVPHALVAFAREEWREALECVAQAVERQTRIDPLASRLWASRAWQTLIMLPLARLDEAFANIDEGVRSSEEEGLSAGLRVWSMLRCRALLASGRLSDACAEAEATIELSDEAGADGHGYITNVACYVLGCAALHTGGMVELRAAATAATRMSSATCTSSQRLGVWLLARLGDADETLASCQLDIELLDPLATSHLHAGSARTHSDSVQLVRMLVRAGRTTDAATVAQRLEAAADGAPDYPFLRAASAHASALLNADFEQALRAVDLYQEDPRPLIRASASEDAGRLLPSDRGDEAAAHLDAALGLYSAAGAERDVARVRRLFRARGLRRVAGGRRTSSEWPELTKSELAVVRQVAHGATNRETAQRLYLSPYTVNSHLRHVFDKLGIRSRVELARLAAERQLPPP
jgi:DNA-binding CsgD family transcriptional regulator/DNA-binding Lrp family transcriptional regulator